MKFILIRKDFRLPCLVVPCFPLKTVDEKFIEEEKRFRTIEKTVKTMLKNISTYLEEFQVIECNRLIS